MKLVNLTPHDINVYSEDEMVLTVPTSGIVVRTRTHQRSVGNINGVPFIESHFIPPEMPHPQKDILFIVSRHVARQLPDRNDVIVPHRFVKGNNNEVIGCQGFERIK